jgi:hypothetical protein
MKITCTCGNKIDAELGTWLKTCGHKNDWYVEGLRKAAELILEATQNRQPKDIVTVRFTCFTDEDGGNVMMDMSGDSYSYEALSHKNCEIWECEMCNPIIGKCDGCDQEFRQVEEVKSPVSTCKTCDRRLCVDCDCGHDNWF